MTVTMNKNTSMVLVAAVAGIMVAGVAHKSYAGADPAADMDKSKPLKQVLVVSES